MKERLNNLSGKEWLQYSFSIWRDIKRGPMDNGESNPASFPVELPGRIIRIFTRLEDQVLDPFMGSGSTIVASIIEGRNAVGIELSEKFYKEASKRTRSLSLESLSNPKISTKLFHGNSMELEKFVEPNTIDLCVTSPPYWDVLNRKRSADRKENVNYSDNKNDLGNETDYYKFLEKVGIVFSKVRLTLKDDGYCVVVVMDIRKGGTFYPFHSDLSRVMIKSGYELKDIIIWDRQREYNNMRPLGFPYSFIVNKVHEYVLIFKRGENVEPA